jgi:hypothetical protein
VSAEAALITFAFGGQVTSVSDPQNVLGGAVTVGQAYSGQYTFDSETPDLWTRYPELGKYSCVNNSLQVNSGAFSVTPVTSSVLVCNQSYGDGYGVSAGQTTSGNLVVAELGFSLDESTGTVFTSKLLPLTPPDIGLFPERSFSVLAGPVTGQEFTIEGDVTYLILVPEPCSLLLLVTGFSSPVIYRLPRKFSSGFALRDHLRD